MRLLLFLLLPLFGTSAVLESENEVDIDSLDESDIFDVVQNFIAEKDPILEVKKDHWRQHKLSSAL